MNARDTQQNMEGQDIDESPTPAHDVDVFHRAAAEAVDMGNDEDEEATEMK